MLSMFMDLIAMEIKIKMKSETLNFSSDSRIYIYIHLLLAATDLGRGVAPLGHCPWPWTQGSSSAAAPDLDGVSPSRPPLILDAG